MGKNVVFKLLINKVYEPKTDDPCCANLMNPKCCMAPLKSTASLSVLSIKVKCALAKIEKMNAEILGDPYHKLVPLPRIQSRAQCYSPSMPSKGTVDTPAVATAANTIQLLCKIRASRYQRTLRTDARRHTYLLNHFAPKILTN